MLRIEKTVTPSPEQWEIIIEGMRNPKNSWDKSDSYKTHIEDPETLETADFEFFVGDNDLDRMTKLSKSGTDHRKFMRMIIVYVDITAPLYWWKEFDTYKVGTVANSCSTMHKIHEKEFTLEDFSCEKLMRTGNGWISDKDSNLWCEPKTLMETIVKTLNACRDNYSIYDEMIKNRSGSIPFDEALKLRKKWWHQLIQLLPSSYNQKRTVMLNYEVLCNIYHSRKDHKLDEWHTFCDWIKTLPYSELITGEDEP